MITITAILKNENVKILPKIDGHMVKNDQVQKRMTNPNRADNYGASGGAPREKLENRKGLIRHYTQNN